MQTALMIPSNLSFSNTRQAVLKDAWVGKENGNKKTTT
uniref:Uncharacterized protein n=1 Tax=Anguilla anguilla TaxID=7936 RepID=A0A0E9XGT8_ANGAN